MYCFLLLSLRLHIAFFNASSGMTNSQHSKVPLTHFVFFSHVAFIYLLVLRTISLSTTLSGLLDVLRSFSSQHGPWEIISGLSNLIRLDTTSAQGHGDSCRTDPSAKFQQMTEMFCWVHSQLISMIFAVCERVKLR